MKDISKKSLIFKPLSLISIMADPIVNTPIDHQTDEEKKTMTSESQIGSSGIFGGEEDVFDNEELFQSIDGTPLKKSEKSQEDTLDLDIDIDEEIKEENKEEEIQEGEIVSEEKFDPIFGDEQEEKQEDMEEEKEIVENIPSITTESQEQKIIKVPREQVVQQIEKKEEAKVEEQEEIEDEIEVQDVPQTKENTAIQEEQKIEQEPQKEESDLMKKFGELVNKARDLYEVAQMEDGEYVEMLGGSTGTSQVMYNLWLINEDDESQSILISKIETDSESQEEQQNNLQFKGNTGSLEIFLDEVLLYDELQDLQEDQNKKMQVIDKLNKFIFLVSEELKIYERDRKEKERMEQERRKLRDIFRNF